MPSRTELVTEQAQAIVAAVRRHGSGRLKVKQLADVAIVIGGSPIVLSRAVRALRQTGQLTVDGETRVWLTDDDRRPR